MCGIVGFISRTPLLERCWLEESRDLLKHRGPDDCGSWWSACGRVGLAHRRLSIIDISTLGRQPMHDANRDLTITFNGEIYNYKEIRTELLQKGHAFTSATDTEVILASYQQWGTACLRKLNGMFAFALHDAKNQQVFLARDRAGEKPLFYHASPEHLFFASELKALLAIPSLPRRISPESLDCYLSMGFVPGEACILEGYQKLAPAHALLVDLKTLNIKSWRYWSLPNPSESQNRHDDNTLVDELETLLQESVSRQLAADVPVGILLSGGLDSSIITALAARQAGTVKTFSIAFADNPKYDESSHARLIADHFSTEHTELQARPATAELLPSLAAQFDEPIVDSSMIPTWLVSNLVRKYCTVALGGDGGDELFGGYMHYSRLLKLYQYARHVPRIIRKGAAQTALRVLPLEARGRGYLSALGCDFLSDVPSIANYFSPATRARLLHKYPSRPPMAETVRRQRFPQNKGVLERVTRMDFYNYLPEDILVKVDRATMMNSLELRAPMLDTSIIEFAFSKVPSRLKASPKDRKILLKQLAKRLLPVSFDLKRKQGFSVPLTSWLKQGPYRELFWDTLNSEDTIFSSSAVTPLLLSSQHGSKNSERLFALVLFELWRQHYKTYL